MVKVNSAISQFRKPLATLQIKPNRMQLNGKHIIFSKQADGKIYAPYEVFFFHRGRNKDPISVGFIQFELVNHDSTTHNKEFQGQHGSLYELAPISTNISEQFHKNWDLILELPSFKK